MLEKNSLMMNLTLTFILCQKEDNFYRANYLYGKLLSELIAAWSNETLEVFVDLHPYAFGKKKYYTYGKK